MSEAAGDVALEVAVNGRRYRTTVPARLTLADYLRDRLGLTGTHLGCGYGVCGACTVLVDGASVRSCLVLAAQVDGREVHTVEGLTPQEGLSPIQRELAAAGGLQCGFCTPGFVVAITELLRERPDAGEDDVRRALDGNICRCTGYQGIVDAVVALASARRGG